MMTLTPTTARLAATACMVFIMTFTIVLVSTLINFGIGGQFFFRFLRGWIIAFLMAYPMVLFLMPRIQKLFQGFVTKS